MSKKHNKVHTVLNYIEYLIILASVVTWCISSSGFASLLGIHIGIKSSAIGLKISAITAGIKNYKSIIKEKKKEHDKIALFPKNYINSIEALIFKSLIDSNLKNSTFNQRI